MNKIIKMVNVSVPLQNVCWSTTHHIFSLGTFGKAITSLIELDLVDGHQPVSAESDARGGQPLLEHREVGF